MKKKGWLIYRRADAERNRAYIDWMQEEAIRLDWTLELVYRDEVAVGIRNGQPLLGLMKKRQSQIKAEGQADGQGGQETDRPIEPNYPDFVIMRAVDPALTTQLEHLHIPVFNSAAVSRISNDKAWTYQCLQQFDIPMLDTQFCNTADLTEGFSSQLGFRDAGSLEGVFEPGHASESMSDLQAWDAFRSLSMPFVIKTAAGRGGKDVALIESPTQLKAFIARYPNTDVVLQQLGPVPGKDIRVFVVGDDIVAAVLRSSTSADFRANFSLGGQAERYPLNKSETALVKRIMSHFNFGMAGIDFLPDGDGGLLFNEIEDVVGSRTLSQVAPEINIVRRYFAYIATKLSGPSD